MADFFKKLFRFSFQNESAWIIFFILLPLLLALVAFFVLYLLGRN